MALGLSIFLIITSVVMILLVLLHKGKGAGLKVILKSNSELVFPEELVLKFKEDEQFKNAFKALTPGRQRAYNLFFSAPKQASTRETRIKKYHQQILNGKGITDCTCGLTKKPPNCDGSHKFIRKD